MEFEFDEAKSQANRLCKRVTSMKDSTGARMLPRSWRIHPNHPLMASLLRRTAQSHTNARHSIYE